MDRTDTHSILTASMSVVSVRSGFPPNFSSPRWDSQGKAVPCLGILKCPAEEGFLLPTSTVARERRVFARKGLTVTARLLVSSKNSQLGKRKFLWAMYDIRASSGGLKTAAA